MGEGSKVVRPPREHQALGPHLFRRRTPVLGLNTKILQPTKFSGGYRELYDRPPAIFVPISGVVVEIRRLEGGVVKAAANAPIDNGARASLAPPTPPCSGPQLQGYAAIKMLRRIRRAL